MKTHPDCRGNCQRSMDGGGECCADGCELLKERDEAQQQDRWDAIRKGEDKDPRDSFGAHLGDDE